MFIYGNILYYFIGETMGKNPCVKLVRVCCVLLMIALVSIVTSITPSAQSSLPAEEHILYVGGSGPGNYTKIQDAVDNASVGDTVFVYDDLAPYYENVVINVPLQLIGENRNTTSIEGGSHAVSIYADGVTVRGFRISNVGDFWNCCGFYVTSEGNTISYNTIINNFRMNGVYLSSSSYNVICGNLIQNNQYHGIRLEYASHNVITDNVLVNNRGYGIYLAESSDNLVVGNTVMQCFWEGLMLGNQSLNNTIYHNNLIDNPANAFDEAGNRWDDGSRGNYWSDYTGSDMDSDGIGDSPYQVPGNVSQDRYPLMDPYQQGVPDLEIVFSGTMGLTIRVKNRGTTLAVNVNWESHFTGGLLLVPAEHEYQGTLQVLAPGQELVIQNVDVLFGIGIISVNVIAGDAASSMKGFLFFVFFIPFSQQGVS
jgi:parallel beta-helix repeat protein